MRQFFLITFFLCFSTKIFGQVPSVENESPTTLIIQPKIGYSFSKTTFNIAGNERGTSPNILSELIWDPTNQIDLGADIHLAHRSFYLRTSLSVNSTFMGNVADTDYDGDNRTLAYNQSHHSNHKGWGYYLRLQPGYFWVRNSTLSLATYLSVDYSMKQLYLLNDKNWTASHPNYISNLNSYYKYRFPSYGLGINLSYNLSTQWTMEVDMEGYRANYNAYGHWNLRDIFEQPKSYEHQGIGTRLLSSLGLYYVLSTRTAVGLSYTFNHYSIQDGKDFAYTTTQGVLRTKLNDANESKHSFLLNLRYYLPLR